MNRTRLVLSSTGLLIAVLPTVALPIGFSTGDVDWRVGARAQYDFLIDADAPEAQQDDEDLRRARAGFSATYHDWRFVASGDFADRARVRDLSLEYRGWPVRIEVGRFQEPFGLAEYGGSKDTLFLERPSPAGFGPNYGLGGALNYRGEAWAISAGAFAASDDTQFGGDANEEALTARLTLTPIREGAFLLHLGAGYTDRRSDDPDGIRITGSAETKLVTGYTPGSVRDLDEDRYHVAGAEFALRAGPVLLQSEYFDVGSPGVVGGDGWYAELGWAITGEKRDYSVRRGNFDGIEPTHPVTKGGIGAIEIGARYSNADLSDGGGDKSHVEGVALNWYPIAQIRLSVDGMRVTLEEVGLPKQETDVVQGRVQVWF
jgi:phosphate-selective porin OprO/OprP